MKMNNKGAFALEEVGKVIMILGVITIITVAALLAISLLTSESVVSPKTVPNQHIINDTFVLNNTGGLLPSLSGFRTPVLTSIIVINSSDGALITSGNYTQTAGVFTNTSAAYGDNQAVKVSTQYSYVTSSDAALIGNNVSRGATNFYSQVPTIFTILGIVAIILVIGLIIYAVHKLRNKTEVGGI